MKFVTPKDGDIEPLKIITVIRESDYFNSLYPITRVRFAIQENNLHFLKDNLTELLVKVTLTRLKYLMVAGKTTEDLEPDDETVLIDSTYIPNFHQDTFSNDSKPADEDLPSSSDPGDSNVVNVNVNLYPVASQVINKKLYNMVLDNCDVGTAIDYILSGDDLVTGVIVDKPDNELAFENLIIVPSNLKGVIMNLQARYGIYFGGCTFFIDDSFIYLLNRFNNSHEFESGDPDTNIINILTKADSGENDLSMIKYDKTEIEYQTYGALKESDSSLLASEITGDMFIVTDLGRSLKMFTLQDDGETMDYVHPMEAYTRDAPTHKSSGTKVSLEYDELNNLFNMSSNLKASSKSKYIACSLKGIDITSIKPNKIFRFVYPDDTFYENKMGKDKKFCLSTVSCTFSPKSTTLGEKLFTCTGNMILVEV